MSGDCVQCKGRGFFFTGGSIANRDCDQCGGTGQSVDQETMLKGTSLEQAVKALLVDVRRRYHMKPKEQFRCPFYRRLHELTEIGE